MLTRPRESAARRTIPLDRLRTLAAEGLTCRAIAAALGFHATSVRALAKRHGIPLPLDTGAWERRGAAAMDTHRKRRATLRVEGRTLAQWHATGAMLSEMRERVSSTILSRWEADTGLCFGRVEAASGVTPRKAAPVDPAPQTGDPIDMLAWRMRQSARAEVKAQRRRWA